ncbi:MAG: LamG domain-containing protein, partial [Verrucomicrobiota bacterium]
MNRSLLRLLFMLLMTSPLLAEDREPPVITCPPDITVNAGSGLSHMLIDLPTPGVVEPGISSDNFAVEFNGAGDVMVSLQPVEISGMAPRTLEFWFRKDPRASGADDLVSWGGPDDYSTFGFFLYDSYLHFFGRHVADYATGQRVGPGWHHLAVTYDGKTVRTYFDGNPTPVPGAPRELNTMPAPLSVMDAPNGAFGHGAVDELRIWNVARSESEIRENMSRSLSGNESGLVHYYRFDEGPGMETVSDSAGQNHARLQRLDPARAWIRGAPAVFGVVLSNSFNHSDSAFGIYPLGKTDVIWTATDLAGNRGVCTQTVSVFGGQQALITRGENRGLDFDGNNDRVVSLAPTGVSGAAPRTLEFWFRLNPASNGSGALVTCGDGFGYALRRGSLHFYGPPEEGFDTGYTLDQAWHHLALTYDGQMVRTYVDGRPTRNPGGSRTLNTPEGPLLV